MILSRLWRPSLARRLVLLAALLNVAVLLVTGVALSALFHRMAVERFDNGLAPVPRGGYFNSHQLLSPESLKPCAGGRRLLLGEWLRLRRL